MYIDKRMSTRQIAKVCGGVASSTVLRWLANHSIPIRSVSDAKRGQKPAPHTIVASVRARRIHRLDDMPEVGYKLRSDGYVHVSMPDHPFATADGYILQHRLVMEKIVGRFLLPSEDVHHKNEIRHDNRPENLELKTHSEHLREHYHDRGIDERGRFK